MHDDDKSMKNIKWLGFTPDTSDEKAREIFAARYGYSAEYVLRTGGAVLAGPIPNPGAIPC